MSAPRLLDVRGLRCPWPVLRLAATMRDAGPAGVAVLADDPAAAGEIRALAGERGWSCDIVAGRIVVAYGPAG